jgi:NADH:ubiquinone reductase (H+-translocating)
MAANPWPRNIDRWKRATSARHRPTWSSPAPPPFHYRDQGALATIGRSSAVADLPHLKLTGWAGRVLWSIVHIHFLIDFRNRMAVFLNWIRARLTYARSARLITGDDRPE